MGFNVLILYRGTNPGGLSRPISGGRKAYNLYGGEWILIKFLITTGHIFSKFMNGKPMYLLENILKLKFLSESPTTDFVTTKNCFLPANVMVFLPPENRAASHVSKQMMYHESRTERLDRESENHPPSHVSFSSETSLLLNFMAWKKREGA